MRGGNASATGAGKHLPIDVGHHLVGLQQGVVKREQQQTVRSVLECSHHPMGQSQDPRVNSRESSRAHGG
jgi:hypothetical protein